jgi:hypothetical protein
MIEYLWEDHPQILSKYLAGNQIDVPEAWYELIHCMLVELEMTDPTCRVLQIKVKFGKLRVYAEMDRDKISIIDKTLSRYEEESLTIPMTKE